MIEFPVNKDTASGYLALPAAAGTGPGVLVLHAWWGLNDFFKSVCDRLAREGFVALAPDLHHGKIATTIEEAEQLVKVLGSDGGERASADIAGAVAYLRGHPEVQGAGIGCIGFSLGASYAYDMSCARPADIAAVVAFYGAGDAEADYSVARAAYLGQYVEGDEWEEDEYVDQLEAKLRADGREATFYRYSGLKHWFMEEDRPEYNAEAAALAWQRTLDFLHRHVS